MTKSKKNSGPVLVSSEISGPDRTALTHAYKAGLIWRGSAISSTVTV